jgi:hypothetical protein
MSNTDLATLIAPDLASAQPRNGVGSPIDDETKMEAIVSVAELMEKGTRSTAAIQEHLAKVYHLTSRPTAIKYRNLAAALIAHEHKPMNRENIRALEIGRITYWLERVTKRIEEFEEDRPTKDDDDYFKWHDSYAKLLGKFNDLGARLHAITGLNELTINNNDQPKRVIFIRPGDTMPKSHNVSPDSQVSELIEGEVSGPGVTT